MIPLRDDNPTTLAPVVTVAIMALCVWYFCATVSVRRSNMPSCASA
jgi:hypothetical protein